MQEKCRWKSAVCIFSHFSCILPRVFAFCFRNHVCPVGPGSDLHLFCILFACFSFFVCICLLFAQVLQLFSKIMFVQLVSGLICIVFAVFLHLSFRVACFNPMFFALFLHFVQDVNILEQAHFDTTNLTVTSISTFNQNIST